LLSRQADNHHALAVGADEVAAERAEQLVAVTLPRLAELGLGHEAEMGHDGQADVLQRQLDVLPRAGPAAMPLRREQADGDHLAGDEIPGGQHVVDGSLPSCGPVKYGTPSFAFTV